MQHDRALRDIGLREGVGRTEFINAADGPVGIIPIGIPEALSPWAALRVPFLLAETMISPQDPARGAA